MLLHVFVGRQLLLLHLRARLGIAVRRAAGRLSLSVLVPLVLVAAACGLREQVALSGLSLDGFVVDVTLGLAWLVAVVYNKGGLVDIQMGRSRRVVQVGLAVGPTVLCAHCLVDGNG